MDTDDDPSATRVIQGDANDYNVLIDPGDTRKPQSRYTKVSGILDRGDMVESFVACESAIANALLDKDDPLAALAQVVSGFHSVYPSAKTSLPPSLISSAPAFA